MCPVCAVAVGMGLGLSRWLKIDDAISGLWVGALLVSLSLILAKQNKIRAFIYFLAFATMTYIPLSYYHVTGNPQNILWGMDKLYVGSIFGIIVFIVSILLHEYLKHRNNQKSYFPFQKVIIPVGMLLLASIAMYLVVR